MEIRVECYAGYRGEEAPRAFFLGERWIEVVEVRERWLEPDHRYFKIEANDGGLYILRQDIVSDKCELTLFKRQGREP